jgi:glycosyltransferase DesVII
MRVLLAVPSSPARLHGLVPLGWALRTAGHEVQIAGQASFTGTITATGFVAVSAGDPAAPGDPLDVEGVLDYAALWRPDLVIWDAAASAVADVARKVGATGVRVLGPLDHHAGAGDAGAATLNTLPPSLRPAAHAGHRPVRFVSYTGPWEIPAWMARKSRRPRVYVSLADSEAMPARLFHAAGGRHVEIVCAAGRLPDGLRLPANVRLMDGVPQATVLASCAAVVHDGAPMPVMTALARGLPQLALVPDAEGLPGEIARLGAGMVEDPARADSAALAVHLDRLLGDAALRERAERLRQEIAAMPAPREVVPELVALAANR